ncbi:DUF417 family protein [Chitinophaga solisilvae]|uniref:DUF417 family protein n=1 Tax=Chitinophaga solisilvae TaxID=1233460 RepID=UPI00137150B0|nr:DUF417 family protein [Chitinophaga solisilvae]
MLTLLASLQSRFIHFLRIAIFLVMAWIGALKACQYEADGIVPFVANSPFMRFFYQRPYAEYKAHKNPEGKVVMENIQWHRENGTYIFSWALGAVIIVISLLVLSGIYYPQTGLWGGLLTAGMSLVTLSFLVTTPEAYVPDLGGPAHGFPYLAGPGRLVLKDVIMLAGGLIIASDSAARILRRKAV